MKSNLVKPDRSKGRLPNSLSPYQFSRLIRAGKIVDGRAGGLLFGKAFDEGGICTVYRIGDAYVLQGLLVGGQFIVNSQAASLNMRRLHAMNAGLTLREMVSEPSNQPPVSQVIITCAEPDDRILFLHWGQMVVDREATAKHLAELVEMNDCPNPYLKCDLRTIFEEQTEPEGGQ
jgi:hypothetical protein